MTSISQNNFRAVFFVLLIFFIALPLNLFGYFFKSSVNPEDTLSFRLFAEKMAQKESESAGKPYLHLDSSSFYDVISRSIDLPLPVVRIVIVGDVMPGTNYPSSSYLPSSCKRLLNPVRKLFLEDDVTIGNLEGVFSSEGGVPKNCRDPKTCYVFRMPDSYAGCLKENGFDILGVANNHVNDFGYAGRKNTAKVLDKEEIPFAGFPDRSYCIYEVKGFKIAYCAFAPHTGTLNFKDYDAAAELVYELKMKADIVIVGFHAGAEGRDHQHITRKDEVFLGHNRGNPWLFARKVIDAGADLVAGHGPHVVRGMEFYKGKLIAYSLGNFCTYARFNLSGPNAFAPALDVTLNKQGEFVKASVHSFLQKGQGGPVPDPGQKAMRKIRDLSRIDFPEGTFTIDDDGNILISRVEN